MAITKPNHPSTTTGIHQTILQTIAQVVAASLQIGRRYVSGSTVANACLAFAVNLTIDAASVVNGAMVLLAAEKLDLTTGTETGMVIEIIVIIKIGKQKKNMQDVMMVGLIQTNCRTKTTG